MKKISKLFFAFLFALVASAAPAAQIPLLTGPYDSGNALGSLNSIIQSFNFGTTGMLGSTPAPVTSSGTALQALQTYTLPGGQLSLAGQGIHIKAWGSNSADANVKTLTFSFGTSNYALIVTGSGNTWIADLWLYKTGANAHTGVANAQTSTTMVAPAANTDTITDTAAITITINATAATSGTMTLAGSYIEQLK